ncbi:unnamed protein product [Polarella glacialis]|uniref:ShKT domain-containing protein n=1 Tax=Polarella glacialis TaxID=89957 RepID=A0A813JS20_POLGL|nr:unnamed protein product [Polarella glacialis]
MMCSNHAFLTLPLLAATFFQLATGESQECKTSALLQTGRVSHSKAERSENLSGGEGTGEGAGKDQDTSGPASNSPQPATGCVDELSLTNKPWGDFVSCEGTGEGTGEGAGKHQDKSDPASTTPQPAIGCVDELSLANKPWGDFVSCADEIGACADNDVIQRGCKLTCGLCGAQVRAQVRAQASIRTKVTGKHNTTASNRLRG